MPHVVLGRILRATLVQQRQHLLFQRMRIHPFFDDVILVEDIAHEMAVIELVHQLAVNLRRQMFKPLGIVTTQGNIQRQNILYLFGMHSLITDSRTRRGEAVQEGFAAFFRRAGEEIPVGSFEELGEPALRFGNSVPGHFQRSVKCGLNSDTFSSIASVRPFMVKKNGILSVPSLSIIRKVSLP